MRAMNCRICSVYLIGMRGPPCCAYLYTLLVDMQHCLVLATSPPVTEQDFACFFGGMFVVDFVYMVFLLHITKGKGKCNGVLLEYSELRRRQ